MTVHAARLMQLPGRKKPWRVTYWEGGKRKTRHFFSKGDASIFAKEYGMEAALPALAVTTEERILLATIRQAAERAGVSIESVAEAAVDLAKRQSVRMVDCPEAAALYLAECDRRNLRPATIAHYRQMVVSFAGGRGYVRDLTRADVSDWICARYQVEESRRTARTPLMAWLRWCGRERMADPERWREPLRWATTLGDDHAVGILRPAVFRLLVRALPPHYRFALALACLTGIRPIEMMRMDWSMINRRSRSITLPGSATKIRRSRVLSDLPPAVWQWVEWERARLREAGKEAGRIVPCNYRNWRERIRQTMREHDLGDWPHDATRHSFASYGYHVLGAERTVELMGHVGGYGLFAKRYKGTARACIARLWFGVLPSITS
jgi:integrase